MRKNQVTDIVRLIVSFLQSLLETTKEKILYDQEETQKFLVIHSRRLTLVLLYKIEKIYILLDVLVYNIALYF